ncbi:glycosyltransferase [Rubrivirga sp. IMCC43871]|uniref:glycosyltransferase n=1 Tax=Rubrivirga sp. IMCC43871 TaxID=3391575 RepID=UPI00399034E7
MDPLSDHTPDRPRVCFVVASETTAKAFLLGHLRALSERYDLTLVANTDDTALLAKAGIRGTVVPVRIERPIDLRSDLAALLRLRALFRHEAFDAVHSVTPKAGLLAMTAAALAGVPVRTHTFTGQVWATRAGPMRTLLKAIDRLTARSATHVLADSRSQLDFLVAEGVVARDNGDVLANGSIAGVDTARFAPDPETRARIRAEHGIGPDDVAFLFLGRLSRDKGVADLARAFVGAAASRPNIQVLVVGPDEDGLRAEIEDVTGPVRERVRFVGFTPAPETFMAAVDVFCLPSYREGFGSVVIEAAAVGIPAIASRIYGVVDAVEEGVSGLLHEPRDIAGLRAHIEALADDPDERRRLGRQARERALDLFGSERVVAALVGYYGERLPTAEPPTRDA